MESISSVKNEKVKQAGKLLTSAKARRESGLFVLEGLRLCMDVVRSNLRAVETYVSADFCERHPAELEALTGVSDQVYLATDAVLEKLSDTRTPQGVCCVVRIPEGLSEDALLGHASTSSGATESASSLSSNSGLIGTDAVGRLLLLENIQDPANLGAIARTAEALGLSGLVVCGGCDVYSPKALRASMGALLRLPVLTLSSDSVAGTTLGSTVSSSSASPEPVPTSNSSPAVRFLSNAKAAGWRTFASTPRTDAVPVTEAGLSVSFSFAKNSSEKISSAEQISAGNPSSDDVPLAAHPVLVVIGNEANGVTEETMAACDALITIPMAGRAESLNAAAAAAILMWEMVK